jgi:hypothetical protein
MPTKTEQTDLLQVLCSAGTANPPCASWRPQSPADSFDLAVEACRLALTHMTPVVFLSDGYLANSAEPWKLPEIKDLPKITVDHPRRGKGKRSPFAPMPKNLGAALGHSGNAWTGTPDRRVGKTNISRAVSYDPDNHEKMVQLRAEKVARIADDIPLGPCAAPQWESLGARVGQSTHGAIHAAVDEVNAAGRARGPGPFPLFEPLPQKHPGRPENFEKILVPELNTGQLLMLSPFPIQRPGHPVCRLKPRQREFPFSSRKSARPSRRSSNGSPLPPARGNPVRPKYTKNDFVSGAEVRWCPGCGDYSILGTVQQTLAKFDIPRENYVFVSGIGCSSRFPYYMNTYGFHTIHGRAPTIATGLRLRQQRPVHLGDHGRRGRPFHWRQPHPPRHAAKPQLQYPPGQ